MTHITRHHAAVCATRRVPWVGILLLGGLSSLPGCSALSRPSPTEPPASPNAMTYIGEVQHRPVTTVFFRNAGSIHGGAYVFVDHQDVHVPGRLSDCHADGVRGLSCQWQDKYGIGRLSAAFSEDWSTFEGFRAPDGVHDRLYCWTGQAAP